MHSEVAKPTTHLARFLVRLRSREAAKFFSNLAGTPGDLDLVLTATVCSAKESIGCSVGRCCHGAKQFCTSILAQEYKEGDYLTVHSDMKPGEEANGAGATD